MEELRNVWLGLISGIFGVFRLLQWRLHLWGLNLKPTHLKYTVGEMFHIEVLRFNTLRFRHLKIVDFQHYNLSVMTYIIIHFI